MAGSICLNLTESDWEDLANDYRLSYRTGSYDSSKTSSTTSSDTSIFQQSESSNTCTDGKDDGKIGLGSLLGNIAQGAVKSVVNGIKGCFFDSDGNFSIGKTLLTVGLGAACVAFPAAGLVMCGIGIVSGGATMASGIYNVVTADTDAEAKDAAEAIGEGGLTLATSIIGAKASVKAVKSSSTAGLKGLDEVTAAAAKESGKTSALSQLDDSATITQKISALGKDMVSSTKNNGSSMLKSVKTQAGNSKAYQEAKNNLKNLQNSDEGKKLTKAQSAYDKAKKALDSLDETSEGYAKAKEALNSAESALKEAQTTYASTYQEITEAAQTAKTAKSNTITGKAKSYISEKVNSAQESIENVKNAKNELKQVQNSDSAKSLTKAQKALTKAQKAQEQAKSTLKGLESGTSEYADAQKALSEATQAVEKAQETVNSLSSTASEIKTAQTAVQNAKQETAFGKLTTSLRKLTENSNGAESTA